MKDQSRRRLLNIALWVCAAGFAGSGGMLAYRWQESRDVRVEMESLAVVWNNREENQEVLQEENPDLAGWISIPGTKIDYPVMQSEEFPDYYLDHGLDGEISRHGVPYIAEGCNITEDSGNIVLYGHHMKDGTMFADLMNYRETSFFQSHQRIFLDTAEEQSAYQIIGAMLVPAVEEESRFYTYMQADNEVKFQQFMDEIKARSLYDTGQTAAYGDRLLTLITCEYTKQDGRMIVVAKKVSRID